MKDDLHDVLKIELCATKNLICQNDRREPRARRLIQQGRCRDRITCISELLGYVPRECELDPEENIHSTSDSDEEREWAADAIPPNAEYSLGHLVAVQLLIDEGTDVLAGTPLKSQHRTKSLVGGITK